MERGAGGGGGGGGASYEERKENQKEKGHRRVLNISSETLNRVEGEGGWEKG